MKNRSSTVTSLESTIPETNSSHLKIDGWKTIPNHPPGIPGQRSDQAQQAQDQHHPRGFASPKTMEINFFSGRVHIIYT